MKTIILTPHEIEKIDRRLIKIQHQLEITKSFFERRGYDINDIEDTRYDDSIAQIDVAMASIESYLEHSYDFLKPYTPQQ